MSVLPQGWIGGTTLNPSITSYDTLSVRVQHQLGAPLINLEITDEQMYQNINDAIEFFTKWAGYTEEYMIFDSKLYVPGVGIKVDDLINRTHKVTNRVTDVTSVSGVYDYEYDYDLASYRKVVDCFSFDKGEDTGINTLFTLEQAMASQVYNSYMLGGGFGFDLVTWEVLKGFIDTRDKVLAMRPHFRFDSRNQILKIIPEPQSMHTYLGVVGCYIEKPIKDVIKERWVFRYVLAQSKITICRAREKYSGTNLFGGGSVNINMLAEGLAEKEKLEEELKNSYVDNFPPIFFINTLVALLIPAFLCVQNTLQSFIC